MIHIANSFDNISPYLLNDPGTSFMESTYFIFCPPHIDMIQNNLIVRFQYVEALGNAEQHFIAIAPRSTLARNGSTW